MAGAHVLKERSDSSNDSRPKSPREQQGARRASATSAELVPTLEAGGEAEAHARVEALEEEAEAHAQAEAEADLRSEPPLLRGEHAVSDERAVSNLEASLMSTMLGEGGAGAAGSADNESTRLSMRATVLLSLLSGALMGGFAPLETLAQDGKSYGVSEALIPYSCSFYFCLAAMLSSVPICVLLARHPLSGPAVPSIVAELRRGGVLASAMPFLGGAVWTLGTTLNFVAGKAVASQAVAYSIGQAAPMVAALWGIFYFKEFSGTGPLAWLLLSGMFACYIGAVVAVALSSGSV